MVAADRPVRKRTPVPTSRRCHIGEVRPSRLNIWTAPQCYRTLIDLSKALKGEETACMPSSQRSLWY